MYAAVVSMLGGATGAQDVLQETNAALLEKASEYDPARPFIPWAMAFARTQVLAWRKKQTRDRLILDDELLSAVADRLASDGSTRDSPPMTQRLEALENCLTKLPPAARDLVDARYIHGESVQTISARIGRSVNAISVSLFRIRQGLLDCVRSTLASQGES
jgi:RNA polymerase sigma-70 factor (ECF subfamily)